MILQSHRALQARPKDSNTVKRSSVVTKVHIHALVLTEPGRRCGRPVCADRRGAGAPTASGPLPVGPWGSVGGLVGLVGARGRS